MDLKEQQKKLNNQIAELETRRRETEEKLRTDRARLDAAKARRSEVVAELANADEATEGWAEGEAEKIEREITSRKRFIEAHEVALAKIETEAAPLRAKLAETEQATSRAEHEKDFLEWTANMKELLADAEDALNSARIRLAELNILAVRGSEQFGGRANTFMDPVLDAFFITHANAELNGWRRSLPAIRPMNVTLQPMVRR